MAALDRYFLDIDLGKRKHESGELSVDWIFDGIGTLLVGLILGGAAGGAVGWRIGVTTQRQSQKAGANSEQTQIGRDQIRKK